MRAASLMQLKCDVHDLGLPPYRKWEPGSPKYLQHAMIIGQNLRYEFPDPRLMRNRNEMAHERCSDALALILVDHHKGYLGLAGPHNHIARAADHRPLAVLQHSDQSYMVDEIDVQ